MSGWIGYFFYIAESIVIESARYVGFDFFNANGSSLGTEFFTEQKVKKFHLCPRVKDNADH
jgi:hypothetical protein